MSRLKDDEYDALLDRDLVKHLKIERGHVKGRLTKKRIEIKELMKDRGNVAIVASQIKCLETITQDFELAHDKYHKLLTDDTELSTSQDYYKSVIQEIRNLYKETSEWCVVASRLQEAANVLTESAPTLHVQGKQLDNTTVISRVSSKGSSISSAKAKVTARKAALLAEASTLKERNSLEQEEFRLKQRKREFDMNVELAKAEAEEKVYNELERDNILSVHDGMNAYIEEQDPGILTEKKIDFINSWRKVVSSSTADALQPHTHVIEADVHALPIKNETASVSPEHVHHPNTSKFASAEGHNQSISVQGDGNSDSSSTEKLLQLIHQSQLQQHQLVDAIQLPKTDLMTFDGDPLKYYIFMRSFENIVDKQSISANAKLARLLQYCTGKARTVIQCCAVIDPEAGYLKAKGLLKQRFGNDYVISESWISKVTEGACIKASDRESLQDFADELLNCYETLNAMDRLSEIDNQRSLISIVRKLPIYLQCRWRKEAHRISIIHGRSHIKDLVEFVKCAAEEANDPVFGSITDDTSKKVGKANQPAKFQRAFATSTADDQPGDNNYEIERTCPICNSNHTLFNCDRFKRLTPEQRLTLVREKRLCHNCLQAGHFAYRCYKESVCSVTGCGRKHSTFLHQPKRYVEQSVVNISGVPATSADNQPSVHSSYTDTVTCNRTASGKYSVDGGRVALPFVPIGVHSPSGIIINTYALLDSGSTNTFCSAELLHKLGQTGRKEQLTLTTLERDNSVTETRCVKLVVSDIHDENFINLPRVYSRPQLPLNADCLARQEDILTWPHLQGLELPHVDKNKVMLLIGQDAPDILVPLEVRKGPKGSPYATKSLLGWSLNGPLGMSNNYKAVSNFIQSDHKIDNTFNHQLENLWHVESSELLSDDNLCTSINDDRAVAIWEDSIRMIDGHYQMRNPFKDQQPCLPNNRTVAVRRLQLLGKRLGRDAELYEKYCAGIDDLFCKGYAEEVPRDQLPRADGKLWYLPHHPVLQPLKNKLRIVFDCSAKFSGSSLNDHVLKGPDLMNDLTGLLIRFREESIAIMADVESMFHQVKVTPDDCDVLRFLWWPHNNLNEEPKEYRMVVHLFGGVWSPSCTSYALKRTAEDHKLEFDGCTVKTVNRDFYVDDCLKSLSTEEEAIRRSHELYHLLSLGGFRLTKWVSNSRKVLESIPPEERANEFKTLDLKTDILPSERALGLQWNVQCDQFVFKIVVKDKPITKRGLLSVVSSVFDPLGFIGPYIMCAKMILQKLCRMKLDWDESIPHEERSEWLRWLDDLKKMEQFQVSRSIKPPGFGHVISSQIHHFSDGSMKGYGVVSYLRMMDSDRQVHCSFLLSKCRLAPLKQMTIPRLELSAAAFAVKVDSLIRKEIDVSLEESVFWTDSTLVLQYISNTDKRFQTFVANRIATIHGGSKPTQWRYVEGESNPADDVSRGMTAAQLLRSKRWLYGPDFLLENDTQWPKLPANVELIPLPEVRKNTKIYITRTKDSDIINELFHRCSSWYKLKKNVAWLLRLKDILLNRIRKNPQKGESKRLTVDELKSAEREIVKYIQLQHFDDEIRTLQSNRTETQNLKRSSSVIRLDPMLSPEGVLCVGGRLRYASISVDSKHQIILPKNHHVVDLIVRHYHELSAHAGREHVLALIRQKYWILGVRRTVSRILKTCLDCGKQNSKLSEQKMADLPAERITPDNPPFTTVGVDYFGPFMVKRGRSLVKRYGCVFTCLTTRAIHIEVAHSLDTSSFINALQRFVGRRGQPRTIRSDNGTNFVGANTELRRAIADWNQDKLVDFLRQREIEWIFNPPGASHMGGVWERQIRTIRKVLCSVLKQQTLDDESLCTLMCHVEAIVNSRPITAVSDDIRDPEALTPNHLLLLRAGPVLPPGIFVHDDLYSRRRWRQVQYLADVFWRRWLREYLPTLQQRHKWFSSKPNMSVGDIVMISDENTPRNLWPLARVIEMYPGKDGFVRTVKVKTQSSSFVRPIDKLCLLENI